MSSLNQGSKHRCDGCTAPSSVEHGHAGWANKQPPRADEICLLLSCMAAVLYPGLTAQKCAAEPKPALDPSSCLEWRAVRTTLPHLQSGSAFPCWTPMSLPLSSPWRDSQNWQVARQTARRGAALSCHSLQLPGGVCRGGWWQTSISLGVNGASVCLSCLCVQLKCGTKRMETFCLLLTSNCLLEDTVSTRQMANFFTLTSASSTPVLVWCSAPGVKP